VATKLEEGRGRKRRRREREELDEFLLALQLELGATQY
jgi:hypothetical protein